MELRRKVIAGISALTLGAAAVATPAEAAHFHGGGGFHGGGFHGGGGWHGGGWHGGYGGWGGGYGWGLGALGVGLAAGALASGAYYGYGYPGYGYGYGYGDGCVSYQPTYDSYGNYIGRRPVNAC